MKRLTNGFLAALVLLMLVCFALPADAGCGGGTNRAARRFERKITIKQKTTVAYRGFGLPLISPRPTPQATAAYQAAPSCQNGTCRAR